MGRKKGKLRLTGVRELNFLKELFNNNLKVRRSELPDEMKSSVLEIYRILKENGFPLKMKRHLNEYTANKKGIKDLIFKVDFESNVLKAKQRRKRVIEELKEEVRDELKPKTEELERLN